MTVSKLIQSANFDLYIQCEVDRVEDIEHIPYSEFECRLYKQGKYLGDISELFGEMNLLVGIIDEIDWDEVASDTKYELRNPCL